MIQHKKVSYSDFSAKQLFDLVMDIEKYPEFIPWCTQALILDSPKTNVTIAELNATFAGISEKYSSRIESIPPRNKNDSAEINTDIISGPFKHLHSKWSFAYDDKKKKTKVKFYIEFEFSSKMLQIFIGTMFEKTSMRMLEAFEERAKQVYYT